MKYLPILLICFTAIADVYQPSSQLDVDKKVMSEFKRIAAVLNGNIDSINIRNGSITELDMFANNNSTIVTGTYTILLSDRLVVCNSTSDFTVTLPSAITGRKFSIKNINTGLITVEGDSTDTIDGHLNISLLQWESITVQCYISGGWVII